MKPANFDQANTIYRGGDLAGDLFTRCYVAHVEGIENVAHVESRWILSGAEREAIAKGAAVVLTVLGRDLPPMRLEVMLDGAIVTD